MPSLKTKPLRALPLVVVCLCGCPTPMNTRLPMIGGEEQVDLERRSYNLHDPFPDEDFGPDTMSRPPGFVEQRSEPRRIDESVPLSATGRDPFLQPQPFSSGYPGAVRF